MKTDVINATAIGEKKGTRIGPAARKIKINRFRSAALVVRVIFNFTRMLCLGDRYKLFLAISIFGAARGDRIGII